MEILIIDATEHNILRAFLYKDNFLEKDFYYEGKDLFSNLDKIFSGEYKFQYIGINKGPGSFTRTKVSLAYVKGYCYGLGIPLVAISGFDVLEKDHKNLKINAGRGNIYIKKNDEYSIKIGESLDKIDYNIFLKLVKERIIKKEFDNPLKVLPLYISEI